MTTWQFDLVGLIIGLGKFSVVYKAIWKANNEPCALKKIAIVDQLDRKTVNRCLKEVRLIQAVDHQNIIRYQDAFLEDSEMVIVLEWAGAGDLKRQIKRAREKVKPFEERIVWKYFIQIARAIQHMHQKRIIHRDLKPANIFLMLTGMVKVGDLGLGRFLSEHTMEAYSKVGTPLYMAPEVLQGIGYDFKSDIWRVWDVFFMSLLCFDPHLKKKGYLLLICIKRLPKDVIPQCLLSDLEFLTS